MKAPKPLVSVIIPNYNHARYLPLRIESVVKQSYANFEVIILDDKSTDDSVAVINRYADDEHVSHIVVNEKNSGSPFVQWEKGIALAKGELIWIAESDDIAEPQLLEKAVEVFTANRNVAICQVGAKMVDSDGNDIRKSYDRWTEENDKPLIFSREKYINDYLRWSNTLYNASGIVFRKDCVETDVLRAASQFKVCGDWLFWLNMAEKGDIAIVRKKLNIFRRHAQSVSIHKSEVEDLKILEYLTNKRRFTRNTIALFIATGIHQRNIKHIDSADLKSQCSATLSALTGIDCKMPYNFSQFCKFLNRIVPLCVYPPKRKF